MSLLHSHYIKKNWNCHKEKENEKQLTAYTRKIINEKIFN